MTTAELFREDAYPRECDATVTTVNDLDGIILDQTVFYPLGGGQPGDSGVLKLDGGGEVRVATTVYDRDSGDIVHVPNEGQTLPAPGARVRAVIDWDRRHRLMRMHSAMHLICSLVPCPVTGGQVGDQKGRLDFDMGEYRADKEALSKDLNALVDADHPVAARWITEDELDAQPDLVRTMSVQPPRSQGRVCLIGIGGDAIGLQPCGGTHVATTGEIGPLRVAKIESKGKQNKRVQIVFDN